MNILVLAGTVDARKMIEELKKEGYSILASVTTPFGAGLLEPQKGIGVLEGKLSCEDMQGLLEEKKIQLLIDATHPYAEDASINAIKAAKVCRINYLRFERDTLSQYPEDVIVAENYEDAAKRANQIPGNIFLTTGSKSIAVMLPWIDQYQDRLFVRILPDSRVLHQCEALGLNAKNIMAAKGPFSRGLNLEMLKHVNASVVVTKDSGKEGGTIEKLEAARAVGIPMILIKRPEVNYPVKVHDINAVIQYVKSVHNIPGGWD